MDEAKKHHTATPPSDLITAVAVAKRLGVTAVTVRTLAKLGKIPCVTFGTTQGRQVIRFQPGDVEEFVRASYRPRRKKDAA